MFPSHDQYYLLSQRPHPFYKKFDYIRCLIFHYLLNGNGYAKIERNDNGRPINYRILNPKVIRPQIIKDKQGFEYLVYHNYQTGEVIFSEDMIHIADMSADGIIGKSRIQIHRETIGQAIAQRNYGSDFFDNATNLTGVVTSDGVMTNERLSRAKESFNESFSTDGSGSIGCFPVTIHYCKA